MPLFYQNTDGERLRFDTDSRFRLLNVEGLGGLQFETRTVRSPYQDGRTFIDSVAQPREIELTIAVYGETNELAHEYFAELSRAFSPKLGEATLEFEYAGKTRALSVITEQAPVYLTGEENRTQGFIRTTVSLVANNPYWKDDQFNFEELQTWINAYELPITLPYEIGISGDSGVITNGGDVETPLQIEVLGGFTPPLYIRNLTTDEEIIITQTLDPDERLFIDTTPSRQRVSFIDALGNQTNGFHFLDPDSRLFQLQRGTNSLQISALDVTTVYISYKRQYISF